MRGWVSDLGKTEEIRFLAHSRNQSGLVNPLRTHLEAVARRAAEFASVFGVADEARLAGLLHDLGKYGDLFQKRLRGEAARVDHWSPGAWAALTKYKDKGLASVLAIQGHHIGLQQADKGSLASMNPNKWDPARHEQRRLSETKTELLIGRLENDGLTLPAPQTSVYKHVNPVRWNGREPPLPLLPKILQLQEAAWINPPTAAAMMETLHRYTATPLRRFAASLILWPWVSHLH